MNAGTARPESRLSGRTGEACGRVKDQMRQGSRPCRAQSLTPWRPTGVCARRPWGEKGDNPPRNVAKICPRSLARYFGRGQTPNVGFAAGRQCPLSTLSGIFDQILAGCSTFSSARCAATSGQSAANCSHRSRLVGSLSPRARYSHSWARSSQYFRLDIRRRVGGIGQVVTNAG